MKLALQPARLAFVFFGVFWGSWAVAAADIEHSLHLSAGGLGLLLSGSIAAGGVAAAASGGLAERWGPARFLGRTMVAWGVALLATAAVTGATAFVVTFVLTLTTGGLVDMGMNSAAAEEVAGDAGRMMRFHALFNTGALIGAAAAGGLLRAGMSWRWVWAVVGVGGLVVARASVRASVTDVRPDAPSPDDTRGTPAGASSPVRSWLRSFHAIRSERLVTLAFVFAVTAMIEGGIDTWGVLYLRTELAAGVLLGAGAYCLGQAIAVFTRGGGGGHIGRLGARWGLVIGAGAAASGLAIEAGSSQSGFAAIGLVVAAGGISLCWPLVMAVASAAALASTPARSPGPGAATSTGVSPAALVGALTATGYVGWVTGPALVGWVADDLSLSAGLFLLAALAALATAVLALIPARPSAVA
jgi:hypothetical protein